MRIVIDVFGLQARIGKAFDNHCPASEQMEAVSGLFQPEINWIRSLIQVQGAENIILALEGHKADSAALIHALFAELPSTNMATAYPGDSAAQPELIGISGLIKSAFLRALNPDCLMRFASVASESSEANAVDVPLAFILPASDIGAESELSVVSASKPAADCVIVLSEAAQQRARDWNLQPQSCICPSFIEQTGYYDCAPVLQALAVQAQAVVPVDKPDSSTRKRLAFVSPLPPEHTGIAYYSAELLPVLAEHYEIILITDQISQEDPWIKRNLKIQSSEWLQRNADQIDRVVYQVGNSPYHHHMLSLLETVPGVVVLHDFYLGHLAAWLENAQSGQYWTRELYRSHGYPALLLQQDDSEQAKLNFPVNFSLIRQALGVIVHSEYSRALAADCYQDQTAADWHLIPHLRTPAQRIDRLQARQQLGLDSQAFIVCSFGFLGPSKLNHRLIDAWRQSKQAQNPSSRLIFVGENCGGEYGDQIGQLQKNAVNGQQIIITGFVTQHAFKQYLMAADLAVQLRTQARGETSGTALDCMNYGLPLIVNANGSMAGLAPEAVYLLPDEFTDEQLVIALDTLAEDATRRQEQAEIARRVIATEHDPARCAALYAQVIEHSYQKARCGLPGLLQTLGSCRNDIGDQAAVIRLAQNLALTFPPAQPASRLMIDVSVIYRDDLKTGIERVVRALVTAMIKHPPRGWRIEPVYLCEQGQWHYRFARSWTAQLLGLEMVGYPDQPVDWSPGDRLLMADLIYQYAGYAQQAGIYRQLRAQGIPIYAVVYDILPVKMPEVFPPCTSGFRQWLETIAQEADAVVCISRSVAGDLRRWLAQNELQRLIPLKVDWFHLGADIVNSRPSTGFPVNGEHHLRQMARAPSFIMVGTIEPRKACLQVIEAFTLLWQQGHDVNLIIVGKEGWQGLPDDMRRDIPQTVARLNTHPERDRRLFWLQGISDEYLEQIYQLATALIAASLDEGFGLPLIEAAHYKLPMIVRDIPVFREVAGTGATYFSANNPEDLAETLVAWLTSYRQGDALPVNQVVGQTWRQSAEQLVSRLV